MEFKPRERNIGHFWCDKQVVRFFRKYFDKKEYNNLRNVYLGLTEIDSDFIEARSDDCHKNRIIHNLTRTCSTYCGKDIQIVSKAMQFLKELKLIDYGKRKDNTNKYIGSYLFMYKWENINIHLKLAINSYMQKDDFDEKLTKYLKTVIWELDNNPNLLLNENSKDRFSMHGDFHTWENQCILRIYNRYYKNIIKNIIEKVLLVPNNTRFEKPISNQNNNNNKSIAKKNPVAINKTFSTETNNILLYWKKFVPILVKPLKDINYLIAIDSAFKKYKNLTEDEFKHRIKTFANLLEQGILLPKYNRCSLKEFINPSDHTLIRWGKLSQFKGIKSLFIECSSKKDPFAKFGNGSAKIKKPIVDKYPELTALIKETYMKNSGKNERELRPKDKNSFVNSAIAIKNYIANSNGDLTSIEKENPQLIVEYLFEALEENWKDYNKIYPGHLCNKEHTFDILLPKYIENQRNY